MKNLHHHGLWLLLCGVLTACAGTAPVVSEGEAGCEAPGELVPFEQACAEEQSVVALCSEEGCAVFRCREVAGYLMAGQVVRTRGGGLVLPQGQGSAMRFWGSAQPLPGSSRSVFIIPWGPRPPPELLPSQKQMLEELKALRSKPYEMHHLFPKEFKEWFREKGIDIDQYTMPLEVEEHRRIHRGKDGGPWNEAWRKYIENNPNALKPEIEKYAGQLIYEFRLYGLVVPFRPRVPPPPVGGS
ncbi:MAG: TIGR02269 family lipoprotein [Myxococcaceae bacterium]|nr:TIGR02269 family lipoprotein [Myxococcaceae bacterium]